MRAKRRVRRHAEHSTLAWHVHQHVHQHVHEDGANRGGVVRGTVVNGA
jgi:hypothetical protein